MLEADLPEGREKYSRAPWIRPRTSSSAAATAWASPKPSCRARATTESAELPGVSNPDQAIETIRSTGQPNLSTRRAPTLRSGMIINTTNKPTAVQDYLSNTENGSPDPALTPTRSGLYHGRDRRRARHGDFAPGPVLASGRSALKLTGDGADHYNSTSAHRPAHGDRSDGVVCRRRSNAAIRTRVSSPASSTSRKPVRWLFRCATVRCRCRSRQWTCVPSRNARRGFGAPQRGRRFGGHGRRLPVHGAHVRVARPWRTWRFVIYVLFNLAIYKIVPVTLTLAGITGFSAQSVWP